MTTTTETPSLKAHIGALFEALLNKTVALDPDLPDELAVLDGRSMTLIWKGPEWALSIMVDKNQLRVGPADAVESDISLRSTLDGLIGLLQPESNSRTPVGRVQVSGDAELLRHMEKLIRRFDPDWEGAFASRFGPIMGPQIARHLRDALFWIKDSVKGAVAASTEYVTEESRDVVAKHELAEFSDNVDQLRDAVERAEVRVNHLLNKSRSPANG